MLTSRHRDSKWPDAPDRAPIPLPIFDLIANNASCPGKKQELFIVPPTWNKMGYYGDIRPVWGEAVDVLKDAENIIVIGYSWPKTDHFFSYLYALGTAGDTLLRRFVLVDIAAETIDRYRAMLGQQAIGVFKTIRETFQNSLLLKSLAFVSMFRYYFAVRYSVRRTP